MKLKLTLTLAAILTLLNFGVACTTFVLNDSKGNMVFGRNFDFPVVDGHIHINYRNIEKRSFIRPPEAPLTWVSKYGSISFNQAGKEFPYGGMNEKGLVIEQMWLQEANYPQADGRYGLSELQWIQYQLDNSATVKEVIDSDSLIRISYMAKSYLHFLVSDAEGNTATIEYIDGKMVVHKDKELPYKVLANCAYQHSLNYKSSIDRKENVQYNYWTENSSGRFVKVSELISKYSEADNIINYSFNILDSVNQPNNTQWSIVYDITNSRIHYKTSANKTKQTIDFKEVDFSCNSENLFVTITEDISGINSFHKLTFEDNYGLMELVVNNVEFLKNSVPKEFLIASARYIESINCKE